MAISQNWDSQIACNFMKLQILVKHTTLWCQLQNTVFRSSKMAIQADGGPVMALMAYGLWQDQCDYYWYPVHSEGASSASSAVSELWVGGRGEIGC